MDLILESILSNNWHWHGITVNCPKDALRFSKHLYWNFLHNLRRSHIMTPITQIAQCWKLHKLLFFLTLNFMIFINFSVLFLQTGTRLGGPLARGGVPLQRRTCIWPIHWCNFFQNFQTFFFNAVIFSTRYFTMYYTVKVIYIHPPQDPQKVAIVNRF